MIPNSFAKSKEVDLWFSVGPEVIAGGGDFSHEKVDINKRR